MLFRLFIAILASFIIIMTGHYYVYERILGPLTNYDSSIFLKIFLLLCGLNFFGFLLIRIFPHPVRKLIEVVMFTWMGSVFILLLICIMTIPVQIYFSYFNYSQTSLSVSIFMTGIIIISYALYQALRKPAVIQCQVLVPQSIPKEVENLTVAVISDIHISGLIGRKQMEVVVDLVNKENPDLIFVTGDLMDGSLKQLQKEIEPLKNLKAHKGILYITGNHEYYSGPLVWKNYFEQEFKWKVLSNSSQILNINNVTLNILGVEDRHWLSYEKIPRTQDERFKVSVDHLTDQRLLSSNNPPLENCLNIILAHQPKDTKYLKLFPWIHLQVSGHTHGGQIWPLHYLVKKDQKYVAGLHQVQENQFIYVNQGTGFWGPPMRLGSQREITVLKFKRNG